MSFNFALVHLPNTDPASLGSSADPEFAFDEATSYERSGPSVAQHGADTILVDPTLLVLAAPLLQDADGATLIALSGVSDTYVIQRFGGDPRLRVYAEGEIVEDDGEPLEAESALADQEFPEDAHLAVFERLTGLGLSQLGALRWSQIDV